MSYLLTDLPISEVAPVPTSTPVAHTSKKYQCLLTCILRFQFVFVRTVNMISDDE